MVTRLRAFAQIDDRSIMSDKEKNGRSSADIRQVATGDWRRLTLNNYVTGG